MHFSFNIRLTDEDYYFFNEFTAKHMPAGKKTEHISKITVAVILLFGAVNIFLMQGFTPVSLIAAVFLAVIGAVLFLSFGKINAGLVRLSVKALLKKDKKPYTPDSTLEFYDSFFKEIAPDNKSEINYTAIDKISVVPNRYIFIFLDGIRGYIVPFDCFRDSQEEKEFIAFLGTLTENIEFLRT